MTRDRQPKAAAPADILSAHPAVRYDPKERCPELRVSDEGDAVVVVIPGQPLRGALAGARARPSQVPGLDAAAVSCVMKIRFQPATRPGDAQPVESWQQLWLRYAVVQGAAAPAAPALSAGGTAAAGLLAAGAGNSRPAGAMALSGCAQLSVTFEVR